MPTPTAFAAELLQRLVWTSLQACVLIGAVALLLRLAPRLSAAMRSALWWLVGAQLLLGLAWNHPVALPLLTPAAPPTASLVAAPVTAPRVAGRVLPVSALPPMASTDAPVAASRVTPSWPLLALLAWLTGLAAQLPRTWRQWRQARAVRAMGEPMADAALRERCQRQARALGLRRCPELRRCTAIASPQVGGWLRPVVLLPAGDVLDSAEWDMAVAHELAHLARRDLWLGVAPALAQRLFFFHPAVRWAMREYALHREAACDARVMRDHHAAVQTYGRLLLRLGVSHPLHAGLAGASPTFDNLKRRLLMLQQSVNESTPRTRGWLLVALVALAGVLPYRVTAGVAAAAAKPAIPATAAAPAAPAAAVAHRLPLPPPPPPPPPSAPDALPPPPPPPPPPAPPAPNPGYSVSHSDITISRNAPDALALFTDSAVFDGNEHDFAQARRLHRNGKPMLWYRKGDKAYLSQDSAIIARAQAIYAPISALSRQQGELAGQQGEIGDQQAALAEREVSLAGEQADLAGQQAELAGQIAEAQATDESDSASRSREARQRALEQQQARLQQRHAAITREIAAQRQELQAQQAGFARQQRSLAERQQQATRRAEQQIQQLLEDAISQGKALPVSAR